MKKVKAIDVDLPHVIVMVGLPARGKSYMSKKLSQFFNWMGIFTRVFNLGQYRRNMTTSYESHDFFRQDNEQAMAIRQRCLFDGLNDVCEWLKSGGEIAIFDATNSTTDRRQLIKSVVVEKMGFKLFFVESICEDPEIINRNIVEVKAYNRDYENANVETVLGDFYQRIEHYRRQYEPLDETKEDGFSFVKIFNVGEKVVVHKSEGYVQSKIVSYLMNIHIVPRTIYLTGQEGIGRDSSLSSRGSSYAVALAEYLIQEKIQGLRVWTGRSRRSIQTVQAISAPQEILNALNEIDFGICEEITCTEVQAKYPEDFEKRNWNKFACSRGESYEDLVNRLEPVVMELERQGNVLFVSHQAVIRCLLAYFLDKSADELSDLYIPLHTVVKLTSAANGYNVEYVKLPIEAVNTH